MRRFWRRNQYLKGADMPNRIIREGVLDSERYHQLVLEARLLFFELLLSADDYGLLHLAPAWLCRRSPLAQSVKPEHLLKLIADLCDSDLLRIYAVDGVRYGYIPRFGNLPRALKPRFPIPPDSLGGNEIRGLMEKLRSRCRADAEQMQSVRTTSACVLPITEDRLPKTEDRKPKTDHLSEQPPVVAVDLLFAGDVEKEHIGGLKGERGEGVGEEETAKNEPKPEKTRRHASHDDPSQNGKTSRLPTDWQLPEAWAAWAKTEQPSWAAEKIGRTEEEFRDYWLAKGGPSARKADWFATWRTWVRKADEWTRGGGRGNGANSPSARAEALTEFNKRSGERARDLLFGRTIDGEKSEPK